MAERRRPPSTGIVSNRMAMVASAAVMAQRPAGMKKFTKNENWQADAWKFYDEVGELRFGVGWLANGMSRVNLVAGKRPRQLGDEPSIITAPDDENPDDESLSANDQLAHDLVAAIAGGPGGQGQLLSDVAVQLTIPGIGWLLMEAVDEEAEIDESDPLSLLRIGEDADAEISPAPDETWRWEVLSNDELRQSPSSDAEGHYYEVRISETEWRRVHDDHVLIKLWRPHARRGWEPDSPCRAVISTLRQIQLLDEHVFATAQSRLAGAGLLILPNEIEFTAVVGRLPAGTPPDVDLTEPGQGEDDFVDVLIETASVSIGDRSSAAAVVPLAIRVPGEYVDKVKHITFWSEFSEVILPLREAAIKRLALGLDMPPEVLLGLGDLNHWTAWQVEETAVTLHIEPLSEIAVHALTIGYLHPALRAAGLTKKEAAEYLVWYDPTNLTARPDLSTNAVELYDRMEISGEALRRETGMSESDRPSKDEKRERRLWTLAQQDKLFAEELVGIKIEEPLEGGQAPPPPVEETERPVPDEEEAEGEPIAAAAIMEACDALVYRALERAGGRMRSAAGKKLNGGAAAIQCDDVTKMHVQLAGSFTHSSLDSLMAGAWNRVPEVATRIGWDARALERTLDAYTRSLIATGNEHSTDRLGHALGLVATA